MSRFTVKGITGDRTSCDCCGRTDLKRTVVLWDVEAHDHVFYGTMCAARATGMRNVTSARNANKRLVQAARDGIYARYRALYRAVIASPDYIANDGRCARIRNRQDRELDRLRRLA